MSPVKSKGKINGKVHKAEAAKKGDQMKSTRQKGSKISQSPCKVRNGKQKCKGASPTLEKKLNVIKKDRRNKADQSTNRSADPKGPQRQVGNKLDKRAPADVRRKNGAEVTKGINMTARPDASKVSPSTVSTRAKNKRDSNGTESEEESESSAGSSAEVTDEELSGDEKEEEQGSSEEATETQRSEESSEEEIEPSDTQRDTEQTGNNDSDKEFSEQSKSDSEVKSVSSSEDEEDDEGEAEVSEAAISDGGEDKEISQEDICARPAADKTGRQQRQTPRPPQPAQKSKFKMFRKTKADKQAEKAEKQKAKAEKQRLEKEAKQKAKEEKKNKKKPQKTGSSTEDKHPPKGISTSKTETTKGKIKQSNNRKNFNENDAPADANATDPDDEEEDGPTLTKAIKGQNRIMLLKTKGKDFKPFLETERQQDAGGAAKGRQQSLLLGKVKMASLRNRANKIMAKPDEEAVEVGTSDGESSKVRERLIARRKGMTTLRRVSGWIHKKVPRGLNLKKKLSAWTRAIGVSRWLSFRAIKQKQVPKKSKGNILKSRMAMRVASKTSMVRKNSGISSENKVSKEKASLLGKAVEGGEGVPAAEKDEAKYAVVLPRMNKLGKTKTAEAAQAAHGPSTSSTGSPEEPTASEPKPPKPGARLVLPVKPDLSLLKSIKKPLSGGLTSGRDVAEGSPPSSGTMEASPNTEDRNRRTEGENQDGVGFLQSARTKLDPSHINLTKISLSGGTIGPNRTKGQDPEREAALGIPRSATQPFSDGKAATGMSAVRSLYEEEADREVAQLMGEGDIYGIGQPEVHWTGNPRMSGDPQVCVIFFLSKHYYYQYEMAFSHFMVH